MDQTKTTTRVTVAPKRATRSARPADESESERIAQLAYQRFLARGASHGHDVDDWLAAEEELRSG
jgi:hypothetical protein